MHRVPASAPRSFVWLVAFVSLIWCCVFSDLPSVAAQSKQMPKPVYYAGFASHYRGDYDDALRAFRSAHRAAFRIGNKRYVDSVCSLTMMGECHYQIGDYATAMQLYNEAIELYLVHHDQGWQRNIQVPATIRPSTSAIQRANVTWGVSNRRGQVADLPDALSVLRGRLDAGRVWQEGGSLDPAEVRAVNVTEIMRCVALALRRRGMINGPAGKYDPLSLRAVGSLKSSSAGNGSYLGALNGVVYGTALASVGVNDQAVKILQSSLQFTGGLDHPLTSLALEQLAEIALVNDHPQEATVLALEGSYSAAWFGNFDMVEQSLGLATQAHLFLNRSAFAPLNNAILWADRQRADMLEVSLRVRLAECLSEGGDFNGSAAMLKLAGTKIGRRNELDQSIITSRLKYLDALNEFLAGNNEAGLKRLQDAVAHLGTKSLWQYRLRTADALVVSGGVTEKQADALYQLTLQDPGALQWKMEPMEAIAFLVSPHVEAMQRWFTIAINRKETNKALQIADTIRRHRFYAALPLGGRLMALRWVLHGDPQMLSPTALKQRQQFLTRYGNYRSLLNDAITIKAELETIPIQSTPDTPDYDRQKKLITNLVKISTAQEAMIASFALRREPAEMAFPPRVNPERLAAEIKPGQLVLITLLTADGYHMFTIDRERTRYLGVLNVNAVKRALLSMGDAMGVVGNVASAKSLDARAWKSVVAEFQDAFLEDVDSTQLASTDELIIVPDGLVWYLPFESFFVDLQSQDRTFGQAMQIRYCPTLALAFSKPVQNQRDGETGVVAGMIYPRTDPVGVEKFVDRWSADDAKTIPLPPKVIFPSNYYAWQMDQLVTLQQDESKGKPFAIQPMAVDTARFGTTLYEWLSLPEWAPDTVVLPGLNSLGGPAGRFRADGSDLFFTSTALLAAGSRSLLLSRWNSGGQMQMELASRFARLSRARTMTSALQQSMAEVRELKVDATAEPRIDFDDDSVQLTGDHPFFLGGQILIALPEEAFQPTSADADDDGGAGEAAGNLKEAPPALDAAGDMGDVPMMQQQQPPVDESEEEDMPDASTNKETEKPEDVDEEDDDDDDEGAVWQIGGKKK